MYFFKPPKKPKPVDPREHLPLYIPGSMEADRNNYYWYTNICINCRSIIPIWIRKGVRSTWITVKCPKCDCDASF